MSNRTPISLAGGVSANSEIRKVLKEAEKKYGWSTYIPKHEYTTDNAAMIGISGYLSYLKGIYSDISTQSTARLKVSE